MGQDARLVQEARRCLNSDYWDQTLANFFRFGSGDPWRVFCDQLHLELIRDWTGDKKVHRVLKTDLFDESAGTGLVTALLLNSSQVHAIDLSRAVVAQAAAKNPEGRFVSADVRHLPYQDSSFDLVVSNSTLDHFPAFCDIVCSVEELYRVLKPGGRLIITFDNLANPVLALRHALPFGFLNRIGLVPYYVGESVTPAGLLKLLSQCGFETGQTSSLMHVPRTFVVPICHILKGRSPQVLRSLLRLMTAFEFFGRWPTRNLTAYYTAALAIKPHIRPE